MGILEKIIIAIFICLLVLGVATINIAVATSIETISLIDILGFCFIGVSDLFVILGTVFAIVKLFRE